MQLRHTDFQAIRLDNMVGWKDTAKSANYFKIFFLEFHLEAVGIG